MDRLTTVERGVVFQHTAARRRLDTILLMDSVRSGFNTQPPEGGWANPLATAPTLNLFQHTAARRRLVRDKGVGIAPQGVSTHSRPKAAGTGDHDYRFVVRMVSTHSRPKAAGKKKKSTVKKSGVSTHSRPKAAGPLDVAWLCLTVVSTHSRPKAAG